MSRMRRPVFVVSIQVQHKPQMVRGFIFWILEVEGWYYLRSEYKGTDLCGSYNFKKEEINFYQEIPKFSDN